jgi:hypothetical protein
MLPSRPYDSTRKGDLLVFPHNHGQLLGELSASGVGGFLPVPFPMDVDSGPGDLNHNRSWISDRLARVAAHRRAGHLHEDVRADMLKPSSGCLSAGHIRQTT